MLKSYRKATVKKKVSLHLFFCSRQDTIHQAGLNSSVPLVTSPLKTLLYYIPFI